jgi:hypothetical protein
MLRMVWVTMRHLPGIRPPTPGVWVDQGVVCAGYTVRAGPAVYMPAVKVIAPGRSNSTKKLITLAGIHTAPRDCRSWPIRGAPFRGLRRPPLRPWPGGVRGRIKHPTCRNTGADPQKYVEGDTPRDIIITACL